MTCASCVGIIEHAVSAIKGVQEVSVNIATNTGRVKYNNDLTGPRDIIAVIQDVSFF